MKQPNNDEIIDTIMLVSALQIADDLSTYCIGKYKHKPNQRFKAWQTTSTLLLKELTKSVPEEVLIAITNTHHDINNSLREQLKESYNLK